MSRQMLQPVMFESCNTYSYLQQSMNMMLNERGADGRRVWPPELDEDLPGWLGKRQRGQNMLRWYYSQYEKKLVKNERASWKEQKEKLLKELASKAPMDPADLKRYRLFVLFFKQFEEESKIVERGETWFDTDKTVHLLAITVRNFIWNYKYRVLNYEYRVLKDFQDRYFANLENVRWNKAQPKFGSFRPNPLNRQKFPRRPLTAQARSKPPWHGYGM